MKRFLLNKKSLFLITMLVLLLLSQTGFAAKGSGKTPAGEKVQPSIQVKEPNFNFGDVLEGAEVEHEYVVKNTGTASLEIERVRVG
jgi:Protein of unknown function (DUF1573)